MYRSVQLIQEVMRTYAGMWNYLKFDSSLPPNNLKHLSQPKETLNHRSSGRYKLDINKIWRPDPGQKSDVCVTNTEQTSTSTQKQMYCMCECTQGRVLPFSWSPPPEEDEMESVMKQRVQSLPCICRLQKELFIIYIGKEVWCKLLLPELGRAFLLESH